MSKFKVGDTVRILSVGYNVDGYRDGDIIVITSIDEDGDLYSDDLYFYPYELELVLEEPEIETIYPDIDPRYVAMLEAALGVELCDHYKKLLEAINNAS